jgi:hypothetical protein
MYKHVTPSGESLTNYVASYGFKVASPGLDHFRKFSVFIHCCTRMSLFMFRATSQSVRRSENNEPDLYVGEAK